MNREPATDRFPRRRAGAGLALAVAGLVAVVPSALGSGIGDQHASPHRISSPFSIVDLGTLGGRESEAFAVNDHGQVVGSSFTARGSLHAFSWTRAAGLVDLGTLGGTDSQALVVITPARLRETTRLTAPSARSSGRPRAGWWSSARREGGSAMSER